MWTVEPLVLSVEDMAGWRQVKRAVFARHCNPWSAWTRWASAPLVLVPVWRRSWRDAALVGVWMAVNPMVFGKPAHERAWATRAVLGEEQWIEDRPMDAAMAVNVGASVAGVADDRRPQAPCGTGRSVHGDDDGVAALVLGTDGPLPR